VALGSITDPLEAGEGSLVVHALHLADLLKHARTDSSGNAAAVRRLHIRVSLLVLIPDPSGQDGTDFVSTEDLPVAIRLLLSKSKTISIRIVGDDKLSTVLISSLHSKSKGTLTFFGVGESNSGEIRISLDLLLDGDERSDLESINSTLDELSANTVHSSVDNLRSLTLSNETSVEVRGVAHVLNGILDITIKDIIKRIAHEGLALLAVQSGQIPRLQVLHDVSSDALIDGGNDLTTVGPVHLVTVILLGVVAGSDHDTSSAVALKNAVRHEGSGDDAAEEKNMEALLGEDTGSDFGELLAVVTAIITDNDGLLESIRDELQDAQGKTLGSLLNDQVVHASETSAHGATKTSGTESNTLAHDLLELLNAIGALGDKALNLSASLGVLVPLKPLLCQFFNRHLLLHTRKLLLYA